ncbi:MAG: helix-turn-helix domain-containing protein, partial [Oscillospiraceae bacterium]|nr:helix-turn-helix domain-containing protein [Oscillospiraceae bacterium]
FRQRVLKYSFKKGVSEAARRYHISRKTIYVWRKRYDGCATSLPMRCWRSIWQSFERRKAQPVPVACGSLHRLGFPILVLRIFLEGICHLSLTFLHRPGGSFLKMGLHSGKTVV